MKVGDLVRCRITVPCSVGLITKIEKSPYPGFDCGDCITVFIDGQHLELIRGQLEVVK